MKTDNGYIHILLPSPFILGHGSERVGWFKLWRKGVSTIVNDDDCVSAPFKKTGVENQPTGTERRPTQRPDEVVLGPGGQHGQVEVDHLGVEGRGGDEVVVDVPFHREHFTDREENHEGEETGGQFTDHFNLKKRKGGTSANKNTLSHIEPYSLYSSLPLTRAHGQK